jgi:glycogen(starch) synthase
VTEFRCSHVKVLLVGPYPPPFGGISSTVHDLQQFLLAQPSVDVQVLNIGEGRATPSPNYLGVQGPVDFMWSLVFFARRGYLIHLETNGHNPKSWLTALFCVVAGLWNKRRTIIAFGSGMLPGYLQQCNRINRLIARATIKLARCLICRNAEMVRALEVDGGKSGQIVTVPGFVGLTGQVLQPVPQPVAQFCQQHSPILGAAVNLSPEYGIPLALQALATIRQTCPHAGLILLGIGAEAAAFLPDLVPVSEHVLLAGAVPPPVARAIMAELTVFLRPTYFDGDSVSVREAQALGIPVLASATGMRPAGVVTFQVGNCADLCEKLRGILEGQRHETGKQTVRDDDHGSANILLELYRTIGKHL